MRPRFSMVLGKMDIEFSIANTKGTIQTFISNSCKSKHLSSSPVQTTRYHWHGGVY